MAALARTWKSRGRFCRPARFRRGRRCNRAVGKSGPGIELHHFFQRGVGLFDQQDRGFDHFLQVVRRNIRGHADGDSRRSIDQQIRNTRGENDRLFFAFIEVGNEIDGFLFDVREHFLGDFRKPRFRITHRRRRIAIDGAEISLAVDQRVTHVEILRQTHERVVDRRIAVRMEFAEDFADDLGALAVGLGGGEAQLVHAEKNAAMHGLQSVAHVGQCAADDYAHRVIQVRLLHFRFDIDRRQ